ncbi:DUF3426 domain-containing protein [Geopsychrobacter electrodiphilus]|uniref:DUF3426 domain-containing protein n=1 Tax=Geopsychrobacter electrodiphilus TaxID=225196 RepID=UPI001FE16887|nr:DUF3426 domain-containing protein [Geopsychrobacter electrodiphilus]
MQQREEPSAWEAPTSPRVDTPSEDSPPPDNLASVTEPVPAQANIPAPEPATEENDFGFNDLDYSGIGSGSSDELDPSALENASSNEDDDDFSFGDEYGNVTLSGEDSDPEEDEPFSFGDPVPPSTNPATDVEQEQFSFNPEGNKAPPSPDPLAASFNEDASLDDITAPSIEEAINFDSTEPPLPAKASKTTSRGPLSAVIFIILMLILAILVAGGVLVWKDGPEGLEKVLSTLMGQSSVAESIGDIHLINLQGSFITNKQEGELFVIQGVAVNDLAEARAAIQVKGVIFDKSGKQLMQKTIFCGNPISDNDLRKLSYSKMEEIMGNQFGESLANLNVTTGQSIPFTIVFRKLPKTLSEFVVEVAGSKPAAQ